MWANLPKAFTYQITINKFLVFARISLTCWEDTICLILLLLMFASGLNADNSKNGQVITIHVMSRVRCKVHRPINNSQKGDFLDLEDIYRDKKKSIKTFWEDKNIVTFSGKKALRECTSHQYHSYLNLRKYFEFGRNSWAKKYSWTHIQRKVQFNGKFYLEEKKNKLDTLINFKLVKVPHVKLTRT